MNTMTIENTALHIVGYLSAHIDTVSVKDAREYIADKIRAVVNTEIQELETQVEALEQKIGNVCVCSYEKPNDRCYWHTQMIADAVKNERKECAKLVSSWHIKRGGYTEMAYQIRDRS